jgi:hypothetical protein
MLETFSPQVHDPSSRKLRAFARSLEAERPTRIETLDISGSARMLLPRYCHHNVAQQVLDRGGRQVFGWRFWIVNDHLTAEFHSVWSDVDGHLWDITPQDDPAWLFDSYCFARDRRRKVDFLNRRSYCDVVRPPGKKYNLFVVDGPRPFMTDNPAYETFNYGLFARRCADFPVDTLLRQSMAPNIAMARRGGTIQWAGGGAAP